MQELSIVRGTTNAFGIAVNNPDGTPLFLSDDQVLVFGLKKWPKDEQRVLVKTFANAIDVGVYYLELVPQDTANLTPDRYYYDIGLQHGNSVFYNIIEASPFDIKPNITQLGDGA